MAICTLILLVISFIRTISYGIFELKPSCNIQEWRICSKEMLSIKVMEIS